MDIRKECVEFISNLQSVNSLMIRLLARDVSFPELCKAVDFYNTYKDCVAFEAIALNLTFEDRIELKSKVFSSILSEVFRYSLLYKKHEDELSNFYSSDLFNNDIASRIFETERLIEKSSEIGLQISKMIRNRMNDMDECDGNLVIYRIKGREIEELQIEHRALIENLNERYKSYFDDLKLQENYEVKIFYLLYYFMLSLELIVHKYAPSDVWEEHLEKVKKANLHKDNKSEAGIEEPAYFDMTLVSKIYNICNNEQFEDISEIDFYKSINNPSIIATNLKIKKAETARVCYLIHLLSEKLVEPLRTIWRDTLLEKLEISTSYYKSKYRNAVSGDASIKSSTFAKEIFDILK